MPGIRSSFQSHWLFGEKSYQNAALLEVASDLAVRIVTLPAMVILKMVAFYERLQDRKRKDGGDISFTVAHYLDVCDRNRLASGADADIMGLVGGDIQRAGAMLLGRDMGRLAGSAAYDHVAARLQTEASSSTVCHLVREMRHEMTRGDFGRARVLLQSLLAGLRTVPRP